MTFWLFLSWFCIGAITAHHAKKRGRSPIAWFFIALFFGVFGLLFLFLLPVKEKEEMVTQQAPISPPLAPTTPEPVLFWYYLDEARQQHGPLSKQAFESACKEGKLKTNNYVWNTEMDQWKRLDEI
jgi:hypothetical protein